MCSPISINYTICSTFKTWKCKLKYWLNICFSFCMKFFRKNSFSAENVLKNWFSWINFFPIFSVFKQQNIFFEEENPEKVVFKEKESHLIFTKYILAPVTDALLYSSHLCKMDWKQTFKMSYNSHLDYSTYGRMVRKIWLIIFICLSM